MNCIDCNNQLTIKINWYESYKKKNWYICIICTLKRRKNYYRNNKDEISLRKKVIAREKRIICLKHYSNSDTPFCKCCNEKFREFLTLDHPNNDGYLHRRSLYGTQNGSGSDFYRWLIKNNFPLKLDVLCWNCNISKSLYGICPHIERMAWLRK